MLHVGVNAVVLRTLDSICRNVSGEDRILGIILEVTSCKSSSVVVHSRSIPAGDIHLVCHLADALAEFVSQILVPGRRNGDADRETDGAYACEVVVDGSRAVAVVRADLADAVYRIRLISAQGDHGVHVIEGHLVHQLIPLGIVLLKTAHVDQLEAVGSAGRDRCRIRIFVCCGRFCRQIVADVVESSLCIGGHLRARRCSGCGCIVGELVCTGQISDIACRVVKLVGRCDQVASALILAVVGLCCRDLVDLGIQLGVRVGVDGDLIIARLEDIALGVLVIIRHQLFFADRNIYGLCRAGLEHSGLLELHEVCACLLNAAVCVRRIGVNFNNIFAGHSTGVGDVDREGDGSAVVLDVAHLLREGRVGQTVAERILNNVLILDEAFHGCCLIETIAYIDAFHVVDEGRNSSRFCSGKSDRGVLELVHVGVVEVTEVVPPGSGLEVIDQGINSLGGRIDLTGYDFAQSGHADMSAGSCPDETLDLRVFFDKSEFKRVGAVVDNNDVLEILAYQCHHFLLAVVEHQIVVAGVPVVALVEGVVISCRPVSCSVLISAVDDRLHIVRKVRAFSAGTGDHDHRRVGECLRVRHHLVGVFADIGLGQSPVLRPHTADRAIRLVSGVEIAQLCVGLNAGIVQAVQKADRVISLVQSAGSAAAQHGIGGSPAENIELSAFCQRQNALVLQKHRAFFRDLDRQSRSLSGSLIRDRAASADQIQHRAHRAGADHVHADADACDRRDQSRTSDKALLRPFHLHNREHNDDRRYDNDADCDQVGPDRIDDVNNVTHVDG